MNATVSRSRMNWSARLLIGLGLVIAGAAAAVWALAHYDGAARFLGVAAPAPPASRAPQLVADLEAEPAESELEAAAVEARIAGLEARLGRVENAARRAEGSAGRTDALVVAFATRRAIDRGVALAGPPRRSDRRI